MGVLSHYAVAQVEISFSTGYGYYAMPKMIALQNDLAKQFIVRPKTTSSFPPYWYYAGTINAELTSNISIGLSFAYGSTGGRISYSDYSGSITADQLLNYTSIGVPFSYQHKINSHGTAVQFGITPIVCFTKLDLIFNSVVADQTQNESYAFKSTNLQLQPGIALKQQIVHGLGVKIELNYTLEIAKDKLKYDENKNAYLQDDEGNTITADWSGARMAAGLYYRFNVDKRN
jgi:hypothetical protein